MKKSFVAIGLIVLMPAPPLLQAQATDMLQEALGACILDAAQQEGGLQKHGGSLELNCGGEAAKTLYDIVGTRIARVDRRENRDGAIHNVRYMKPVPPAGIAHPVPHCFEREDKNMGGIDLSYGCNLHWEFGAILNP